MNIFYVDRDPIIAATMLCDKHVVKMILESTQLLSTAHRVLDGVQRNTVINKRKRTVYDHPDTSLYQATHINHPSTSWVRMSNHNYEWLYQHTKGLLSEYTYRYNKIHSCTDVINNSLLSKPKSIPNTPRGFDPPSCMDDAYIISNDAVTNYRNYYNLGKKHLHTWTNRAKPDWIME